MDNMISITKTASNKLHFSGQLPIITLSVQISSLKQVPMLTTLIKMDRLPSSMLPKEVSKKCVSYWSIEEQIFKSLIKIDKHLITTQRRTNIGKFRNTLVVSRQIKKPPKKNKVGWYLSKYLGKQSSIRKKCKEKEITCKKLILYCLYR